MKCTLELYGKTYQSTEFTERQVSLFLAASAGATGINIKDLFEELMGAQQMPVRGLREYNSLESAEKDLALVLKRVFPTLERSIESIDTSELIAIVKPMLFALAGVEDAIEDDSAQIASPELIAETALESELISPWLTPTDLNFPPVVANLTPQELDAIESAANAVSQPAETIECWYQWWRSIVDVGGEEIDDGDAFEILAEFSKGQFTIDDSTRIASALMPYLQPVPEPIAA